MEQNQASYLQATLDELRHRHGVVGASLAILHGGVLETAASGVLSRETLVPVTADSLFQVGSITKVFTATLVMQLVDEGLVDLDQTVQTYLPQLCTAQAVACRQVTVRQLLCHTSGLEGDFFPEDDPFGPSIAGFVERCRLLPQLHPVGERFSYCNSGYTIVGRLLEVVTGRPWARLMQERILEPLGLQQALVDPADALRFRVAMGHLRGEGEDSAHCVAPKCYLPLSHAPAGTVLSMSATDLLGFARAHMDGSSEQAGTLLSAVSRDAMQQPQVALPRHSPPAMTHWGLGWIVGRSNGETVVSHYGGTLGQLAYLRCFPRRGLALAVLTNSDSMGLYEELEAELLSGIAGITLPRDARGAGPAGPADRFVGCYQNMAQRIEVIVGDDGLVARRCELAQPDTVVASRLAPIDSDCFAARWPRSSTQQTIAFLDQDSAGRARYLSIGFRLLRRVTNGDSCAAFEGSL
ncbi:MAG: serine hydrolase domain-containing protein [Haliea sp.]|uniref:serine hydrolase domain-containing protein n=1 Tax=Haliea sp. TaxID=1932666 RepID=UPI0032F07CE7